MTKVSRGVLLAVVSLIALVVFNVSRRTPETSLQFGFESWLKSVEPALRAPSDDTPLPNISVSLEVFGPSESPRPKITLQSGGAVSGNSEREGRQRVHRILQLIQESKAFNVPQVDKRRNTGFEIRVVQGEKDFTTVISKDSVQDAIQLQNLVKLFELYAAQKPAPVEVTTQL